jgi:hypothetical protein
MELAEGEHLKSNILRDDPATSVSFREFVAMLHHCNAVSAIPRFLIVLAVSPTLGFALGFLHFSRVAIVVSGLGPAIVSAVMLQNQGVDFFAGVAIVAACLAVKQITYLIGIV